MKFVSCKKRPITYLLLAFILFSFFIILFPKQVSADSISILPISKGGTEANTARQASQNIIGNNFANYDEILPISKGGTNADHQIGAMNNLQGNPGIGLNMNGTWTNSTIYSKVLDVKIYGTQQNKQANQTLEIFGFEDIIPDLANPKKDQDKFLLTFKGGSGDENFSQYIILKNLAANCSTARAYGFWYIDSTDSADVRLKIFIQRFGWGMPGNIKWLFYHDFSASGIKDFTPEYITSKPTNATSIYSACAKYISKE
ncbi:MAG: hypothetical protein LBT91_00280 [Bifidobacteriaceae bacterium]|jgi:hypothetical protein|nr:hypothetical protein [Bifidobacteriaceae bacterium]